MSERTRDEMLREFGADELARLLPPVVAERVNALADRILALESDLADARREREAMERELQDVRETYDRTIDHLNSDVTYERHRAERAERDGERLDLLQTLEERLTSIEIEHVAGEFWISEMCDDGATCLKTWRGFTIREAFDRALAKEGA